jgi:hypothetical protein
MSALSPTDPISDSEYLLRRVPPGEVWQKPGPEPTSVNVELRAGESGLSASRSGITTPESLLAQIGASAEKGWLVIAAKVGDLRAFGLRVIPKPEDHDRGHVEIEPAEVDLGRRSVRRALIKLFRVVTTDAQSRIAGADNNADPS